MKKTHVPDFPITGHQYLNLQVALLFCAIHSAGQSARSSVGMSTGRSVRSSVGSRNVVHFLPCNTRKL
jgi:hypothetical protein